MLVTVFVMSQGACARSAALSLQVPAHNSTGQQQEACQPLAHEYTAAAVYRVQTTVRRFGTHSTWQKAAKLASEAVMHLSVTTIMKCRVAGTCSKQRRQ